MFNYRKKFKPNTKRNAGNRVQDIKKRRGLYTESWDSIRKQCYRRDGYRCVMCGKKGKISAHHIVPVRISHNNSLTNLVSVCDRCHKRLEEVGFAILRNGGHQSDVRRVELTMIMEAKQKRKEKERKLIAKKRLEEGKDVPSNN